MISILIPTYNYACGELVKTLYTQAVNSGVDYEIWVADDASEETYKVQNRVIGQYPHCHYWELPENVGRARIRNLLAAKAQYDFFLFLDCDGVVADDQFLNRYLALMPQVQVACGGIVHPDKLPCPEVSLRYTYEKQAEPRFTASRRAQHPYAWFRSFNFLIRRDVFEAHPFDETITEYGFEDTLLGKALQADGISVIHMDNPLVNGDIETNAVFLRKTECALRTLYRHRDILEGCSGVLSLYNKLQSCKLVYPVSWIYQKCHSRITANLEGEHPSLKLYAFYKIGYFCAWSLNSQSL